VGTGTTNLNIQVQCQYDGEIPDLDENGKKVHCENRAMCGETKNFLVRFNLGI